MFDPTAHSADTLRDLRARVEARGVERDPASGCLLTAPVYSYPLIRVAGHLYRLPQVVYALHNGALPAGLVVDHECHNRDPWCPGGTANSAGRCRHRRCIEPVHLVGRTQRENLLRARAHDRRRLVLQRVV